MPDSVARWLPQTLISLGTDGYGRSDSRERLRDYFEVDARFITLAVLSSLARDGKLKAGVVQKAMKKMDIDPEKPDAAYV